MAGSVNDLSKYRFERCSEELEILRFYWMLENLSYL